MRTGKKVKRRFKGGPAMESLGTGGEGAKALFTFSGEAGEFISHSAYFPIQKFWHSAYQALPSYLEPDRKSVV